MKHHPLLFITLLCVLCGLWGCAGPKQRVTATPAPTDSTPAQEQVSAVITKLYNRLDAWQGVPHLDGGMSKEGIDCSGFTHLTFRELFDTHLPRTTSQLAQYGRQVSRVELQPGDLVFFKIGLKGRHVGIYVESQKFIHASKSKGVMLSRLDNPYWFNTYWQARRVRVASL